ncbi:MAG: hypothetical protein K2H64_10200, partial [Desulfovibrio sp.]|nr:hypothetical protein [Desulfovibrio sp.]
FGKLFFYDSASLFNDVFEFDFEISSIGPPEGFVGYEILSEITAINKANRIKDEGWDKKEPKHAQFEYKISSSEIIVSFCQKLLQGGIVISDSRIV